jgi:hypothetical protein
MVDRSNYLNPNAPSVPCGFLSSSDLDKVRQHFANDKNCEVIVYSLIFQAYNIIYNPISDENYLKKYPNICFYLFVDKTTALNGYSLEHISNGESNIKNSKFKLNSEIIGGQAWRIILLEKLPYLSYTHSMKAIKFAGMRLFPNAKTFLWFDPKYVLKRKVPRFVKEITALMHMNSEGSNNSNNSWSSNETTSVAISEHFFHDVEAGFTGARERIIYQNLTYKVNPFIDSEIQELNHQKTVYAAEGLFNRTRGNVQLVVDSAVMLYHNNEQTRRYFCAWANEISMFSRRDQLSEYAVRE